MTIGTALLIIAIVLLVMMVITGLVELFFTFFPSGKECYVSVKSNYTGNEYHASRYKYNRHGDMELYIYNYVAYKYEWYPIWHFKNSFIIAMQIDKDYAVNNMYKLLITEKQSKDLTKNQK